MSKAARFNDLSAQELYAVSNELEREQLRVDGLVSAMRIALGALQNERDTAGVNVARDILRTAILSKVSA